MFTGMLWSLSFPTRVRSQNSTGEMADLIDFGVRGAHVIKEGRTACSNMLVPDCAKMNRRGKNIVS